MLCEQRGLVIYIGMLTDSPELTDVSITVWSL